MVKRKQVHNSADEPVHKKQKFKSDFTYLKEQYRFIRDEESESDEDDLDLKHGKKLAKRYESGLYKEYCVCDLSRYKTGQVGLRWRSEKEVRAGKGEQSCGSVHCESTGELAAFELDFNYRENNEQKRALVKVRLCPDCATKLKKSKKRKKQLLKQQEKKRSK